MFGKNLLKKVGHGIKTVGQNAMKLGSKLAPIAEKFALPLAVGGLMASGYGTVAIPAMMTTLATSKALNEAMSGATATAPNRGRPSRSSIGNMSRRPMITRQGTPTNIQSIRNFGDTYSGGNRLLGRGNFRSGIPQMRPDARL